MLERLIDAFSQLQGRRTYHMIGNVSTDNSSSPAGAAVQRPGSNSSSVLD
jgi:hypothetical protein